MATSHASPTGTLPAWRRRFCPSLRGQGRRRRGGERGARAFATRFETAYAAGLRRKLGLLQERPDDLSLAQDLLERMARNGADFTLTFRRLCDAAASTDADAAVRSLFTDPTAFDDWAQRWRQRLAEDGGDAERARGGMRAVNPAFIPRNHLVEEALSAAVNKVISRPSRLC